MAVQLKAFNSQVLHYRLQFCHELCGQCPLEAQKRHIHESSWCLKFNSSQTKMVKFCSNIQPKIVKCPIQTSKNITFGAQQKHLQGRARGTDSSALVHSLLCGALCRCPDVLQRQRKEKTLKRNMTSQENHMSKSWFLDIPGISCEILGLSFDDFITDMIWFLSYPFVFPYVISLQRQVPWGQMTSWISAKVQAFTPRHIVSIGYCR